MIVAWGRARVNAHTTTKKITKKLKICYNSMTLVFITRYSGTLSGGINEA
jgi:hypothetical protein